MYFLESTSRDPRFNLALEERLFNFDGEYLMLWQNAPSVIVGKFAGAGALAAVGVGRRGGGLPSF